jgi:phosphatidylglycerophosphatase C
VTDDRLVVAAFDVDGTLTTHDCVIPFLRRVAGTARVAAGLGRRPVRLVRAAAGRDRDALKMLAAESTFAGRPLAEVRRDAGSFARHVHARWLRPESVGRLERHRAAGDVVALVSASFELYLEPLAELLGADHVLGTRLEADSSGVLTGRLAGPNCRGPEKVRRLHECLSERYQGRSHVRVVAYGDSAGDRELLADADEAHWMAR